MHIKLVNEISAEIEKVSIWLKVVIAPWGRATANHLSLSLYASAMVAHTNGALSILIAYRNTGTTSFKYAAIIESTLTEGPTKY